MRACRRAHEGKNIDHRRLCVREVEKEQEPEAEPEPEPEQRLESQLARQTDQVMKRKRWMPRWLFLPAGELSCRPTRTRLTWMTCSMR